MVTAHFLNFILRHLPSLLRIEKPKDLDETIDEQSSVIKCTNLYFNCKTISPKFNIRNRALEIGFRRVTIIIAEYIAEKQNSGE